MDNPFPRLRSLENKVEDILRRLFADETVLAAAMQSLAKNWGAAGAMASNGGAGGLVPALTGGGGIGPGSMAVPVTATVTLLVADENTGALSAGTETVDVLNTEGVTYGATKQVQIYQFMGFWYVAGGDCS